jgi:hypothetical protein
MAGTTKLKVYNGALRKLGERKLSLLTEVRESRRLLDDTYDEALDYCLEQGYWNFAMRTSKITSNPSVDTAFGYGYAFDKPSDWVRTNAVSADEYYRIGLEDYKDETAYWLADVDPLYVRYVSNDTSYGLDLTLWPETFNQYVQTHIAYELSARVTHNDKTEEKLFQKRKLSLRNARQKDAMNEVNNNNGPLGTWAGSRSEEGQGQWREGDYRA